MNAGQLNVILNIVGLLLGGTALGVVLRYRLGMRKLALADEANIRDHYAKEVARYVDKMGAQERRFDDKASVQEKHFLDVEKHLREMIATSDKRHEECEFARAEDRRDRSRMQDEIDGLKRQIVRYSAEGVLVLGEHPPSPMVASAAKRVRKIAEERDK